MFAKAGAVVVTYDPIGEGERNLDKKSRTGAHDAIVATPPGIPADDWGQRLAGLMQVDVMQAVSYLVAQPEVDPRRIATVGYSMGAFITGITGAIDPRIHAVLLSGGGTFDDEADGGKSFDTGKLPCQAPPWRSLRILGDEPHRRGAVIYALNADRGPMLVENGSQDEVMDIPHRPPEWFAALRAQAIALNGGDRTMFTTHVDPGMSHRTAWVERPGVTWLNQQLHFANWSAADIAKMPHHPHQRLGPRQRRRHHAQLHQGDPRRRPERTRHGLSRHRTRAVDGPARSRVDARKGPAHLRILGRKNQGRRTGHGPEGNFTSKRVNLRAS